jgi:hypothetical protein
MAARTALALVDTRIARAERDLARSSDAAKAAISRGSENEALGKTFTHRPNPRGASATRRVCWRS